MFIVFIIRLSSPSDVTDLTELCVLKSGKASFLSSPQSFYLFIFLISACDLFDDVSLFLRVIPFPSLPLSSFCLAPPLLCRPHFTQVQNPLSTPSHPPLPRLSPCCTFRHLDSTFPEQQKEEKGRLDKGGNLGPGSLSGRPSAVGGRESNFHKLRATPVAGLGADFRSTSLLSVANLK